MHKLYGVRNCMCYGHCGKSIIINNDWKVIKLWIITMAIINNYHGYFE